MIDLHLNTVVLPHLPDWDQPPRWRREWVSEVNGALTGAEDRATGRTNGHRGQSWRVTTFSIQDTYRLRARILEALKLGRACAPVWGRPQTIGPRPGAAITLDGAPITHWTASNLVIGQLYYWQKGEFADYLLHASGQRKYHSGYFIARAATAEVWLDPLIGSAGHPGTITPVHLNRVPHAGAWYFDLRDSLFFTRPEPRDRDEQRTLQTNCGGSAVAPFGADAGGSGGATSTTTHGIVTRDISGYAAAPEAVYQSARNLTSTSAADEISYTLQGFQPGLDVRLRLHFAEIELGFDRTDARRRFDILLQGAVKRAAFEPLHDAGGQLFKATALDFVVGADKDGKVKIQLKPEALTKPLLAFNTNLDIGQQYNTSSVLQGVTIGADPIVLLTAQTTRSENGLWVLNTTNWAQSPGNFRPADGTITRKLFWKVVAIQSGSFANTFYRCMNDNAPEEGVNPFTWSQTTKPYNAGINAIEAFQWTWEIKRVADVSEHNDLTLDSWLKGVYPDTAPMYPMIFGKPSAQDLEALNNVNGSIELSIQEPLPEAGSIGLSSCAVEVCETAPTVVEWGGIGFEPSLTCTSGGVLGGPPWWEHTFNSGGTLCSGVQNAVGKAKDIGSGSNPSDYLRSEVIDWWATQALNALTTNRTAAGKVITNHKFFWSWVTALAGWDATSVFEGSYVCTNPAAYTLAIKWCEKNA